MDDLLELLLAHGAELVGDLVRYEDTYRLGYVRGREGIMVGLAKQLVNEVGGLRLDPLG